MQMIIRRDRWVEFGILVVDENAFFLCKICFGTHMFLIWGQTYNPKKSGKSDRKVVVVVVVVIGGGGGGQQLRSA